MRQSCVLRAVYETLQEALSAEGRKNNLFCIKQNRNSAEENLSSDSCVYLELCDLSQVEQDKNGQRVIENEIAFEAPARISMILCVRIVSKTCPDLLECAGAVIVFFKDNSSVTVTGYGWHGNTDEIIFFEPVIREVHADAITAMQANRRNNTGNPFLCLFFRVEAGINSEKGQSVRRVDKRDIKTQVLS